MFQQNYSTSAMPALWEFDSQCGFALGLFCNFCRSFHLFLSLVASEYQVAFNHLNLVDKDAENSRVWNVLSLILSPAVSVSSSSSSCSSDYFRAVMEFAARQQNYYELFLIKVKRGKKSIQKPLLPLKKLLQPKLYTVYNDTGGLSLNCLPAQVCFPSPITVCGEVTHNGAECNFQTQL